MARDLERVVRRAALLRLRRQERAEIARHRFVQAGDVAAADDYERMLLNGIIGNQNRKAGPSGTADETGAAGAGAGAGVLSSSCGTPGETGGCTGRGAAPGATSYIYMLPLGGAVTKHWGKSDYGFPCCWGTLSEVCTRSYLLLLLLSVFADRFVAHPSHFAGSRLQSYQTRSSSVQRTARPSTSISS